MQCAARKGTVERSVGEPSSEGGPFDFERYYYGYHLPSDQRRAPTVRADRHCQKRTAQRRRRIGKLLHRHAQERLRAGVPWELVLDNFAAGTSHLQAAYEQRYGERPSRNTLQHDLDALLGGRTGAMPVVYNHKAERAVQANTYSLRALAVTLGTLGAQYLRKLVDLAVRVEFERPRSYGERAIGPISLDRELRRAVEKAVAGNRHSTGVRLAWRLAKLGVSEQAAHRVLGRYREAVCPLGDRRYERREARRAVESAYRKVTR